MLDGLRLLNMKLNRPRSTIISQPTTITKCNPMNVFIHCAGEQVRWLGSESKHLVDINGVPLLGRTIDQVLRFGNIQPSSISVLARNDTDYRDFCYGRYVHRLVVGDTANGCSTMLDTESLWDDRTIILLGDVYFTDITIKQILDYRGRFCIWWDRQDVFAASWGQDSNWMMRLLLESKKFTSFSHMVNVLWSFGDQPGYGVCQDVCDQTQDFDTLDDYDRFLCGKSKNHLFDR